MSTLSDYLGRTVDLGAFQLLNADLPRGRVQLLIQSLAGRNDGGTIVAGIQKLAQRVLLILLHKRGSRLYLPDEGCAFMIEAERGLWRTVADVEQAFYSARLDVRRQCEAIETDDDPDDERYGDLELTGVTLNADKVTISVFVTSAAGSTFTFLTPITVPTK